MGRDLLLRLIKNEGVEPDLEALAAWTDTEGAVSADPVLEYGAFVDDQGHCIPGDRAPRVWLDDPDPRRAVLDPALSEDLPAGASVLFVDWGRQPLTWAEIFDLWEAWRSQGMVVDAGSLGVHGRLAHRWGCPGWVAFRDGFDGAPLEAVAIGEVAIGDPSEARDQPPPATSLLARAKELRGDAPRVEERLPVLPFTLESLGDPHHPWPMGVA